MGLYGFIFGLVLIVGSPWWMARMLISGRYRAGLSQRLGCVPASLRSAVAGKSSLWIHAVSVGEVMIAARLIAALQGAMAEGTLPQEPIVLSTTTETGQQLARQRLPGVPVFYLPLDLRYAVRRFLAALNPRLLITIESELWPRLIYECALRGTALAVVNARISDRSMPRYRRLRALWRPLLLKIDLFLAQSGESAGRLAELGVPQGRIQMTGNLKYDLELQTGRPLVEQVRQALPPGARVIVAGSTLEGEESALLSGWKAVLEAEPAAVMVLAPRHPSRFGSVAALAARLQLHVVRASALPAQQALPAGSILLLDTIGDLADAYSLASVAFVGGSLVAAGGHNPLEPARFGVPVVMGPSYQNFREIVESLQTADAITITSGARLTTVLTGLLKDVARATSLGQRAQAVFTAQSGATARTVNALATLLQPRREAA